MALNTFAPEYFSQEFERPEMFEFPYLMLAMDRSGLVPPGGNQATWPDVEGSVTTQTYVRGTALTDGEGRDQQIVMPINQNKAVSIPLDDVDRVQRMPAIMGEYMIQADRELLWEMNSFLRTRFRHSTRLAASGLTEPMRGNYEGLTSNVKNLELLHTGGTGTAHNKINSAEGRAELIEAMDLDAATFAKRHGWVAQDADTKGVAVVPMEIAAQFRRYLIDDKPNLGAGSYVDSAFGMGRIMRISGWEILEDVTASEFDVTGTVARNAGLGIDFFHPQRLGLYYGRQLAEIETERIQGEFGTRLKALYIYGAVQGAARHMYRISILLSAS